MKDHNLELFLDIVEKATSKVVKSSSGNKLSSNHILNSSFKSKGGKTLLLLTIEEGKTSAEYTKALLCAGVCPNSWNKDLRIYPLHFAAKYKNASAMRLLLNHGAHINSTLNNGRTALHICAKIGYKEGIAILLQSEHIEVDIKDKKGNQTPLFLAVTKGTSYSIVVDLINHGADLEHVCFRKSIQQHLAKHFPRIDLNLCIRKETPKVKNKNHLLLIYLNNIIEEAVFVNDPLRSDSLRQQFRSSLERLQFNSFYSKICKSILFKLCDLELIDYVRLFFDITSYISIHDSVCSKAEESALLIAAHRGNVELVSLLLEHNANQMNSVDVETKETLLHLILKKDSMDSFHIEKWKRCFKYLFDVNTSTESKFTKSKRSKICEMINNQDALNNTALHHASSKWPPTVVSTMLKYGANIGIRNNWNEAPIKNISWYTIDDFLHPSADSLVSNENHNVHGSTKEMNDNRKKECKSDINFSKKKCTSVSVLPMEIVSQELITRHLNDTSKSTAKRCIETDVYLADTIIDTADMIQSKIPKEKRIQVLNDSNPPDETDGRNHSSKELVPVDKKVEFKNNLKTDDNLEPICELLFSLRRSRERRSTNTELRFFLLFVLVHTWFVFHGLNFKRDTKFFGIIDVKLLTRCDIIAEKQFREIVLDLCYYCYIVLSSMIILFTLMDWKSDIITMFKDEQLTFYFEKLDKKGSIKDKNRYCHHLECYCGRKIEYKHILYVLSSNWKELGLVYLIIILMLEKENYLWKGMFSLVFLFAVKECYQVWRAVKRWLLLDMWLYRENWTGLAMIFFVSVQLFTYYDKTQDAVEYKIHMAAFAMGVSWNKLFVVLINHPFCSRYDILIFNQIDRCKGLEKINFV